MWARLRKEMEPTIVAAEQRRREFENRAVRESRRHILDLLFKAYKCSVPPTQWKSLPPTLALCRLKPFRNIIESNASIAVTEADFAPHMQNIADILASAQAELKTRLVGRAIFGYHPSLPHAPAGAHPSGAANHLETSQLFNLASTVFTCKDCQNGLYGWDNITSHFCAPSHTGQVQVEEYPHEFQFNGQARKAAQKVVREVGLNPFTATVADMDMKNIRFGCTTCDKHDGVNKGSSSFPHEEMAYTWRALVSSFLYCALPVDTMS